MNPLSNKDETIHIAGVDCGPNFSSMVVLISSRVLLPSKNVATSPRSGEHGNVRPSSSNMKA